VRLRPPSGFARADPGRRPNHGQSPIQQAAARRGIAVAAHPGGEAAENNAALGERAEPKSLAVAGLGERAEANFSPSLLGENVPSPRVSQSLLADRVDEAVRSGFAAGM